jgi:hypothetical protein
MVLQADGFPSGLVGTIGARLAVAATGAVVVPRTTLGITETLPGVYTWPVQAPSVAADYTAYWDANGVEASELITVAETTTVVIPSAVLPAPQPGGPGTIGKFLFDRVQVVRRITFGSDDGTPLYDPVIVATVPARLDTTTRARRDGDFRSKIDAAHFNYALCFVELGAPVLRDDLLRFPTRNGEEYMIEDIDSAAGFAGVSHLELVVRRIEGGAEATRSGTSH